MRLNPITYSLTSLATLVMVCCQTVPARMPVPAGSNIGQSGRSTEKPKAPSDVTGLIEELPDVVLVSDLTTLRPKEAIYAWNHPNKQSSNVSYTLRSVSPHCFVATLESHSATTFCIGDSGELVITEEEDFRENVRIVYDPGITQLPVNMQPGKTYAGESKMTVYNRSNDIVRDQGVVKYEMTLVGKAQTSVPAGEFVAWQVRTVRNMKLNTADVQVTIDSLYHPDHGMVAEDIDQKMLIMGIMPVNTQQHFQLVE